jgi:hypothetical protein
MFTVSLQRRRLDTHEPEDQVFVLRPWADFQFFLVALRRLRNAATIARSQRSVAEALTQFDAATPYLTRLRNVGEHLNEYAVDNPKRHDDKITRKMIEVGEWRPTEWRWLGEHVDINAALKAAEELHDVVMNAG